MIVIAAGAAAVYGYLEYRKRTLATDEVVDVTADEGFYPAKAT